VPEGIEAQTTQTIENLRSTLEAAGASLEDVIKVNVYLINIDDISVMSEVYRRYFPKDAPARTTVGVAGLARADLLIEIEMVAMLD
jgi:2-iminobutanoate/2-iminopropanoate deaminase